MKGDTEHRLEEARAHTKAGRPREAEASYRAVIALQPGNAAAHYGIGRTLDHRGDEYGAAQAYRLALQHDPTHDHAYERLGQLHIAAERPDLAVMVFTDWQRYRPGHPVAAHLLAALGHDAVPAQASAGFVRAAFDRFAEEFELVMDSIGYCGPMLLGMVLERELGPGGQAFEVLDAGCGTGLCAPELRPYARTLTGVDLSAPMLEQAGIRGQYDRLVESDLVDHLAMTPGVYDVIGCVETLIYFGALGALAAKVSQALRPDGLFVFTTQPLDGEGTGGPDFRLDPTGRYSHREGHLADTLVTAGLRDVLLSRAEIRTEGGEPVTALVGSARA